MILAIILLFIGLVLIFLEFFLPGVILGILGGIAILAGIVVFGYSVHSILWFLLFGLLSIVLLLVDIKLALFWIKRKKGIYHNKDQAGYVASSFEKEMIDKEGEAASDLKPGGYVLIDGKRFQAVSKTGYITKGTPIQVIGGEGGHLIVKINANH